MLLAAAAALVVFAAGAAWLYAEMYRIDPVYVDWSVPDAPQLTAGDGQTVYRIDPSRSVVTYEVEENLVGVTKMVEGETRGIAGDILVDESDPSRSRVGEMVVNIEQLTSDKALRDERIRQEYLESDRYPLATFVTSEITGLPEEIVDGTDYSVVLSGDLTVKEVTSAVEMSATVSRDGEDLHIDAVAEVLLSDFGAGPISIARLVSTSDEVRLRFDLIAREAGKLDIEIREPELVALPTAQGGDPKFSKTVQPVLESACASCHEPNGSGSGAWELATAADAARIAPELGLIMESRYMPPWPASSEGVALKHSLRLSDDDIRAVSEWVEAGGPLDVDPGTKLEAADATRPPVRRDLELEVAEPYTGTIAKRDDYRCHLLDPKLDEPIGITGYEFVPDQVQIIHHVLVYRLSEEAMPALEAAEARDDLSGWECFGGINVRGVGLSPSSRGSGSDLLMGWVPGQPPSVFPEGTAMHLEPGDVLVMQIHYNITAEPPPDKSTLALQLADTLDGYDDIAVTTYLAPAEIPCPADETAPGCDRATELRALGEEYGPEGPGIANGLHLVCGTTPEQLGVLDGSKARSTCDHPVRNTGTILSVLGHMHEIGSSYRMTLNPDTPEEMILLDIPEWDFGWQFNYAVADEIELKRGDVIRVECTWDRELIREGAEPRYILWAEGTDDEMCYSTLSTRVSRD